MEKSKKLLVIIAIVLMIIGIGLTIYRYMTMNKIANNIVKEKEIQILLQPIEVTDEEGHTQILFMPLEIEKEQE